MLLKPLSREGSVRTLVLRPEVPAEPEGVIPSPSAFEDDSPRRGSALGREEPSLGSAGRKGEEEKTHIYLLGEITQEIVFIFISYQDYADPNPKPNPINITETLNLKPP